MSKGRGWRNKKPDDPKRHALAARGIRTKSSPPVKLRIKTVADYERLRQQANTELFYLVQKRQKLSSQGRLISADTDTVSERKTLRLLLNQQIKLKKSYIDELAGVEKYLPPRKGRGWHGEGIEHSAAAQGVEVSHYQPSEKTKRLDFHLVRSREILGDLKASEIRAAMRQDEKSVKAIRQREELVQTLINSLEERRRRELKLVRRKR